MKYGKSNLLENTVGQVINSARSNTRSPTKSFRAN